MYIGDIIIFLSYLNIILFDLFEYTFFINFKYYLVKKNYLIFEHFNIMYIYIILLLILTVV